MFESHTAGSKDLKLSIFEGSFAAILLIAGTSFIVPFAAYLGANALQVGFLSAFPALLAAWAQLFSLYLLEKFHSRKNIIIIAAFLQALLFIPLALIPFFIKTDGVFWLILIYTISLVIVSIANPLWQSLMKSLTPSDILGRYFGFRNSIVTIIAMTFLIVFGLSLKLFAKETALVFCGIFLLSSFGRLVSSFIFTKISDPKIDFVKDEDDNFLVFISKATKTNFGHFLLFGSLMSFCIALTGPFFSFYLLEEVGLKNDYLMYTLVVLSGMIGLLVAMPYWGKLIDKYGSVKVLKASSLMAAFFPLLYVIVRFPTGLIFVEFIDGIIFAGFSLALADFVFDASTQHKIIRYFTYQTIFFGTAAFIGAMLSGYFQTMQVSFYYLTSSFLIVCVISFVLRYLVYKLLIGKISEVKPVEQIHSKQIVYSIVTLTPVVEAISGRVVPFENGLKKVELTIEERLKNVESIMGTKAKKIGERLEISVVRTVNKIKRRAAKK